MRIRIIMPRVAETEAFTLLETMIAIGLLTIGVVASLLLMSRATGAIVQGTQNLIASNLAAEGIELVRNQRDTNWLNNQPWYYNMLPAGCSDPSSCTATPVTGTVSYDTSNANDASIFTPGIANQQLYQNATGFYTATAAGNTQTPYARTVTLTYYTDTTVPASPADVSTTYMQVVSTVKYQTRGQNVSVSVEDNLYNWR
ncbi:hypothetical protein M1534_01500 [Patescibacteria group bacterium]|nr:hypothetical protein [Patescibacteria group bacterium]